MTAKSKKNKLDVFIDDKYAKLENKTKYFVATALIVIPAALFYFLIFQPQYEKTIDLNNKIKNLQDDIFKVKKVVNDLPKYKKELEEVKKEFEATSVLLPKTQEIPNLLRNISDLGKKAGLDFLIFTPGQEIPKDFYAEIPIDITIKGPYHNLGLFFDKVSKLDRIVTVNNIAIDKPEQEGSEMMLNSACKLLTYRFTNVKPEPKEGKGPKK
jgi:type IV pilus assembly protein PilO